MSKKHLIGIMAKLLKTNTDIDFLSKLTKSEIEKLTALTKGCVERAESLSRARYRLPGECFSKAEQSNGTMLFN